MKKILAVFLLMLSFLVNAQQTKTEVFFGDDTWVQVPLQFAFPFYGKLFTNSFMFSNGVVGFFGINAQPNNSFCCEGVQVNNQIDPSFHYTIMPMQTDLIPTGQSKFYTQGDGTFQKYWWQDIAEISNQSNLNTFSVEVRPTGYIGIQYDKINIQNQLVTSAIIGDASLGQYTVHHYGYGMNASSVSSLIEYQSTGGGICLSNPLSNPNCPGYAQAYHDQQCSISPLYAVTCPGYTQAYHDQQCSISPLYMSDCPGYEQAYFNQQCSINPLYNSGCAGYAVAYFNQQCELDGLYDTKCPNYSTAYAKKTLFEQQGIATAVDVAGTTAKKDPANSTTATQTNTNTTNTTQPETTSVTSTTSVSPAAVVSVIKAPEPIQPAQQMQQTQPAPAPQQQQTQKQEERKTENQVANKMEKSVGGGAAKADKQKMKEAVSKVQKEIAKEMKEASSMEAQAATQGLVLGSMNYVPGFDAYKNALIPDINATIMAREYYKPVVDNRSAQRRLSAASDSKWQEIVDSQYQLGK